MEAAWLRSSQDAHAWIESCSGFGTVAVFTFFFLLSFLSVFFILILILVFL